MEEVTLHVGKLEDSPCNSDTRPTQTGLVTEIPLCMAYYIKSGEPNKTYIKENDETVFIKEDGTMLGKLVNINRVINKKSWGIVKNKIEFTLTFQHRANSNSRNSIFVNIKIKGNPESRISDGLSIKIQQPEQNGGKKNRKSKRKSKRGKKTAKRAR
jgi:hypothetical protein